jgi:hypothetical protein
MCFKFLNDDGFAFYSLYYSLSILLDYYFFTVPNFFVYLMYAFKLEMQNIMLVLYNFESCLLYYKFAEM